MIGKQADAALRAQRGGKRSATTDVFADQRAARLIEPKAAIFFGNVGADQAEVGSFLDQLAREFPVVLFKFVDARDDFVVDKLARRLGNHAMLFGEIFRRENFLRGAVLNQEGATLDDLLSVRLRLTYTFPFSIWLTGLGADFVLERSTLILKDRRPVQRPIVNVLST